MPTTITDVGVVASRAVAFAAIVLIVGAVTFRWAVVRRWTPAEPDVSNRFGALASTAGAWAAVNLVLIAPVRLYVHALALLAEGDPVVPMMVNVVRTSWGRGWLLQISSAIAALVAFLLARHGWRVGWWLAVASAVVLTWSPALMGHAVAANQYF